MSKSKTTDVVLIGAGVMSATLGTFLKILQPNLTIRVFERLGGVAQESSNPWNNAGTGHAALCELNYMPDSPTGGLPDPEKAVAINEQFQLSRQFWAYLVQKGILASPSTFINSTPHMTFVRGAKDVDYLRRRFESLKSQPLFAGMEFSDDPKVIAKWAPLLIKGRKGNDPIAATKIDSGTDVNFGAITEQLMSFLTANDVSLQTSTEVVGLTKSNSGNWLVQAKNLASGKIETVESKFVFVGAGGWALKLLQKSGIPEAKGYGTFPVGGQWLRSDNQALVKQHQAKVYSQASIGAPPMSVPHLDTRIVDGKTSLLFGPYATANPKFLKNGSILDLPMSLRPANLIPYISVGLTSLPLIKYLVGELLKTKSKKFESLLEFIPSAKPEDWQLLDAGQRAQVIKRDAKKGGVLQFGTEVITSSDGSIAALLGASPGASTAVHIMLQILKSSFPTEFSTWEKKLKLVIPSFGTELSKSPAKAKASMASTAKVLNLK